ncbi:LbtU family siderophore porin [Facilibium subflavum]|uniref:LbtU family siderophore porin n=1 Tax=Facilibium subflavum TaxID=2219058 RepID=UPI000E659C78|nr:LbtU family siderophore porin [Facilibium subflavum]
MLKKISLAVLATAVSASAFAADNADNSIQAQITQLKQEIAALKANQNEAQGKKAQPAYQKDTNGDEQNVTVPTNQGQIQNFLFSDIHDGVVPMGMLSSSQFALGLLKQRNIYKDEALVFGGYLEADAQTWHGSSINTLKSDVVDNISGPVYQSGKGIYITTATLYTAANLGHYVTAELSLSGNQNDNPSVSDALVMFGNLADFPVYATIGKNRIPLGSFAGGGPWTGSLTQMLFRPSRVANASVAYYGQGLSTNVTLFQTNDHTSDFSYAAFYAGESGKWAYGVNGGYIYNVSGSGNNTFNALTQTEDSNDNRTATNRIGAVNFEGSLNYDIYGVGAGWAQTTNKSSATNNGLAGAWYVTAGVSPEIYGRSTNFSLSYNGAYNTNDLPITLSGSSVNSYTTDPNSGVGTGVNKMVIASVQRPFFTENVLLGLEYAYMHMYNNQHTNAYTLDVSVYF